MTPAPVVRTAGARFVTAAGEPFVWLADTWWWGASGRVRDDEISLLAARRAAQGFTSVQLVVGPAPDADTSDPRQGNEGGPVFADDGRTHSGYLAVARRRVESIVAEGLVPCIVGAWGYHLEVIGRERMRAHWRRLVDSFADLPVLWCAAGEALMPHYSALGGSDAEGRIATLREGWASILDDIRTADGAQHPLTIHPSLAVGHRSSTDMVPAELIDFTMLQTGHSGLASVAESVSLVRTECARVPQLPVVNAEVCYEGILGGCGPEIQRALFWECLLAGAAGHGYGAQGLWAFDTGLSSDDLGRRWGRRSWHSAAAAVGAADLGRGRSLVAGLAPLVPVPQAAEGNRLACARTRDGMMLCLLPSPVQYAGGAGAVDLVVSGLTPGRHTAWWLDPQAATAEPAQQWQVEVGADGILRARGDVFGVTPTQEDWLLLIDDRS